METNSLHRSNCSSKLDFSISPVCSYGVPATEAVVTKQKPLENEFKILYQRKFTVWLPSCGIDWIFPVAKWHKLTFEQQAVGRAYRLGQARPVFVYRFQGVLSKIGFSTPLFSRPSSSDELLIRRTQRDAIIHEFGFVRKIALTETFQKEEDEQMTSEEQKAAENEYKDQRLWREDPKAWHQKQAAHLAGQLKQDRHQVAKRPSFGRPGRADQEFRTRNGSQGVQEFCIVIEAGWRMEALQLTKRW